MKRGKDSFYAKYIKRGLDFICAILALTVLSPILLILTVLGAIKMKGNPFFVQARPGKKDKSGQEKIFKLIKFRTMTNEKNAEGDLLPDDKRLNGYGRFLRKTSMDELPELLNILAGNMSVVGPRPLLIEYLPWYTEEEQRRHDVRPGLTGLAQVSGRNSVSWDERLKLDVFYVCNMSFSFDMKMILNTIKLVLRHEGVSDDTRETEGNFAQIRRELEEKKINECIIIKCGNKK